VVKFLEEKIMKSTGLADCIYTYHYHRMISIIIKIINSNSYPFF